MVWHKEKDVTPDTRVSAGQLIEAADKAPEPVTENSAPEKIAEDIRGSIDKITTTAQATDLRASVEDLKAQLGITLYTELKNKIVLQHHRLNAIAGLGASIDAAGKNGGTTSQERAELGALLHRSARFLSADEVQRYQQAIDDLSPAQEAAC